MINQHTSRQPFARLTSKATSVYSKLSKRGAYLCAMFVVLDMASKRFGGKPAPSKWVMYKSGRATTPALLNAMASANNVKALFLKLASNAGALHMGRCTTKQRAASLIERAKERNLIMHDARLFATIAAHVDATDRAINIGKIVDLVALAA